MKQLLLFASIALASGLLFTNVYNSLVDVTSWGTDIPKSIETAREYFKIVNPGNFFRVFSPVNQVIALLALILFWNVSTTVRIYLGIALAFYVLGDVFTFAYFYPRNDIMFKNKVADIDTIRQSWAGWKTMNWLRSGIVLAGLLFSFLALHKIYTTK